MTARTPTRTKAYEAIDSERDYQDDKFSGKGHSAINRTLDEFILYIKQYADEAGALTTHENPREALHFVRKVAALCVGCMEAHGAPLRERSGNRSSRGLTPMMKEDLQDFLLYASKGLPLDGSNYNLCAQAQTLLEEELLDSVNSDPTTSRLVVRLTSKGYMMVDRIKAERRD